MLVRLFRIVLPIVFPVQSTERLFKKQINTIIYIINNYIWKIQSVRLLDSLTDSLTSSKTSKKNR